VATLALFTFTTLSEWRSCGVVITKFSGHDVIFRSSPTVFADTAMPGSTSIRIRPGKPPSAICSAPMLLGLYFILASSLAGRHLDLLFFLPGIMALAEAVVAVAVAAAAV
jgi:predicted transporter